MPFPPEANGETRDSLAAARASAAHAAQRGERAVVGGLLLNAALAAVKIFSGLIGDSYALIADGVESLLDIFGSLMVWGSLRASAAAPTAEYPYGLGRAEPLAGLGIALALLIAAAGLAIQSVREILVPHHAPAPFTLVVLLLVVAIKELMFRRLTATGLEIDSVAVSGDAWHHRSDAATSAAAFLGIVVALVGGEGYESADDWAALAACGLIAFNGARLLRTSLRLTLDAAPPTETLDGIRTTAAAVPGVAAIEQCRARRAGLGWLVDIHVEVDGNLPVSEGHRIAHQVKDALLASPTGILDALVHIEPAADGSPLSSGPMTPRR